MLEKIDNLEKVSELYLKGYKPAEIGRALTLSPAAVKGYIAEYKVYINRRVDEDPAFLDRLQENTIEALERLDNLIHEAWETYETCKTADMVNQQINLIKVAGELEDKRAKLLQLMGAKADSGMMARMNKAEQVNGIVSRIIKDVVSDCPHCKLEVMPRLAEAFALMNKPEEAVDMEPMDDDIEEAEIVEEWDEGQQKSLMYDVVTPENV